MHLSEQRSFEDAFALFESRKIDADQRLGEAEQKLAAGAMAKPEEAAEELAAIKAVRREAGERMQRLQEAVAKAESWDDMTFLTGLEDILDEIGNRVDHLLHHHSS